MATIYYSRWVLAGDGTVIENGAVAVQGAIITEVGSRSRVRRRAADRTVNLGSLLLLPGFINIHTHLEESAVRGHRRLEGDTFAAHFAKKNTRYRQATDAAVGAAVKLDIREFLFRGVTTIVDSSRRGLSAAILAGEPVRSWVIREFHADESLQESAALAELRRHGADTKRAANTGVGPYAVFSLSPAGQRELIEIAQRRGLLWMSHVAESSEEVQAFSEGSGDLYASLTRRKEWEFGRTDQGPMHFALANNLIPCSGICIHCNYVTGDQLSCLADRKCTVVVCPQYSEAMEHKPFPLDLALNRRLNLCVATENVADSDSTSLLDELFLLRRQFPHIEAREMIRWITRNPAIALGAGETLGTLAPGRCADMAGFAFPTEPGPEIFEDLLQCDPAVRFVMVNGEEIIAGY
jgi:aminodeoxyfutalosine deaminase